LTPVRADVTDWEAYREIAGWWLLSRVAVFGTAIAAGVTGWPHHLSHHGLELLTGWDGVWYREVATHGYDTSAGRNDIAFFPLLPLLMAGLAHLGVPLALSGVVLGNLGLAAALGGLYALCKAWVGDPLARRAAIYAAVFPMSFVFSMAYPESIALFAAIFAALAAASQRWVRSGILGALAALSRPQSGLIALPLAALAAAQRRRSQRLIPWIAPAGAVLAVIALWMYLWWSLHDPHAWAHAETTWGRSVSLTGPVDALRQIVRAPWETFRTSPYIVVWLLRDVVFTGLYAVLIVIAARAGVPRKWTAYGLAMVALPLFSGSFSAAARYGAVAFPAYVGLAALARGRWADRAVKTTSLVLLVAFVISLAYRYP
jgi:hypothetical protein